MTLNREGCGRHLGLQLCLPINLIRNNGELTQRILRLTSLISAICAGNGGLDGLSLSVLLYPGSYETLLHLHQSKDSTKQIIMFSQVKSDKTTSDKRKTSKSFENWWGCSLKPNL